MKYSIEDIIRESASAALDTVIIPVAFEIALVDVGGMSWYQASALGTQGFRLPTEKELLYIYRGKLDIPGLHTDPWQPNLTWYWASDTHTEVGFMLACALNMYDGRIEYANPSLRSNTRLVRGALA